MSTYTRRLYSILAIDAFLAVLIIFGLSFSRLSMNERDMRYVLLDTPGSVSSISIIGDSVIELRRVQDAWSMVSDDGNLPADGIRVESFLKAVAAVTRLEPVARDKASWARLGLDEENARTITLADGNGVVLSEFTLGSYAQSPGLVYIALDGDASKGGSVAYAASSGFASYALGRPSSWLNLNVWSNPPTLEAVQELVFSGMLEEDDGSMRALNYTVSRSGYGWTHEGATLDPSRVEAAIRSLSSLRGDDYAPLGDTLGPSLLRVEIRLGNGRKLSLSLEARREDGRYPVMSSQRDRRLYLPAWAVRETFKGTEELMPRLGP